MKWGFVCLLSLCVLAITTPASAVDAPDNPGTGVLCLFTAEGLPAENYLLDVVPFAPTTLYFVIYHPTGPEGNIGAIEFSWHLEPDVPHFVDLTINSESVINMGDDHNISAGMSPGAPVTGDHAYVASIEIMFMAPVGEVFLYTTPNVQYQSLPGQMCYDRWPDPAQLMAMVPYSEGFAYDQPVFAFNSQAVATTGATWGEVKALFE